jgi:hypothetical protein
MERDWTKPIAGRGASLLLSAALGLSGCEAFVGSGPAAPYKSEDASVVEQAGMSAPAPATATNMQASAGAKATPKPSTTSPAAAVNPTPGPQGGGPAPVSSAPPSPCDVAPQNALATLTTYCSACHSNPATAKAGFSTILDAPALLASGKVVKDQPLQSAIYKRISTGSMPPLDVKKRPSAVDVSAIEAWISCGAQDWNTATAKPTAAFVSIDSRLDTVLADLRSISNPIDRERMRYIDLSNLANSGYGSDQLQEVREAVSMLMNSLSRGRSVIAPAAVDKQKLIYRIDLRDYLWDSATWTQLEAAYPYAVIYDQDSRLFPADEVSAEQIRSETNTQIPMIQGDWFVSHASRPPLYYSLLQLPDTLGGLEQLLGVDIQRNIDTEQVQRAGFANAGPSQNNRVIERHELGGNRGALWLSYDFSSNLDLKNVFSHPLDFQEDGGEMIFNLENGLQGYFVANAAGLRLDKAPTNVVQDPASRDGAVESGLSCMNCHQTDGQLPKFDEIRDFQLSAGANAQQIESVLAVYVPRAELQTVFDADQNRYRTARAALGIGKLTNSSMHQLDDRHLGLLDLDNVAAVVGLPASDVKRAIDASPQAFPPEIVTLRTQGGGIQRDSFESIIAATIEALGLGQQLRVDQQGRRDQGNQQPDRGQAGAGGSAAQQGGAGGSAAAGSGGASAGGSNSNTSGDGRRR